MYRRSTIRQFSTLRPRQSSFPSRVPKVANGENVKLYRVQFRKPPIRRRLFNGFLYALPLVAIWYYVIPVTLEIEMTEEDEKMKPDGEVEVEHEEELEDGLFIPFGWPTKDAPTFYKGSDPEWKEYVKLSNDPKRQLIIQASLAKSIRAEIKRHPSMKRQEININQGRYWLWIKYPDGPPQDYSVSGLEIGDEFIAWSTKTIPQKEYRNLARSILPIAPIKATWVVLRYHFDTQANRVRQYFGLQPHMDPQTALLKSFITASVAAEKREKKVSPPLVPPIRSKEETSTTSGNQKVGSSTPSETDEQKASPSILASFFPKAEQVPVTTYLFMHTLATDSTKKKADPPRGSIEVKGMVEVMHEKAKLILDVEANYDLKTNTYLEWTVTPKEVQPRKQSPKGGI